MVLKNIEAIITLAIEILTFRDVSIRPALNGTQTPINRCIDMTVVIQTLIVCANVINAYM